MAKQRFFKSTKGYNGEVFVIPSVAVSAALTYALFIAATGPAGQLGVFDADTNALVTTALSEGQHFFVAQRRNSVDSDGSTSIHKSSPYIFNKRGIFGVDPVTPVLDSKTITFPGYVAKAGDVLSIRVIETAEQSHQPPTFSYDYKVKGGDTLTTIYAGLAAAVNAQAPAVGLGNDPFVTATSSAAGLVVKHIYYQASFRIATPGLSYDYAVIVNTTPPVYGSGFYEEVAQLEYEGQVFDGITTQFPGDGFVPSDFPSGQLFATVGKEYAKIQVNTYKEEYSPTPVNKHHNLKHLVLVPEKGSASKTQLDTIFGLTV